MDPVSGVVLSTGEGDSIAVGANRARIKADGKDTSETYSVIEFSLAAQSSASVPHRHPDWDEAFYVLEGEVEVLVGDRSERLRAGSFILVPRGTAHRTWNCGRGPAKILAIAQPWAPQYVRELAQAFPNQGPPDMEKLMETYEKYGVEPVPES
jgi:mannose-6-phosphate isomerase-like protein (cupin superfamily)